MWRRRCDGPGEEDTISMVFSPFREGLSARALAPIPVATPKCLAAVRRI